MAEGADGLPSAATSCLLLPELTLLLHTVPLLRQPGFLISTGSAGIFTFSVLDSCGFQRIQVFASSQGIHITSQPVLRPEPAAAAQSPLAVTPAWQASASQGTRLISVWTPGIKLQPLQQTSAPPGAKEQCVSLRIPAGLCTGGQCSQPGGLLLFPCLR